MNRNPSPRFPTIALLWCVFLLSRVIVLCFLTEATGDVSFYFEHVETSTETGSPYAREAGEAFPYPPLAFGYVALPYLLGGHDFESYYHLFRVESYLVDLLLFALLLRLAVRSARGRAALLVYILATTLLGNLLFHRLDVALGLLLVLALVKAAGGFSRTSSSACRSRSRSSRLSSCRRPWAGKPAAAFAKDPSRSERSLPAR